MGLSLLATVLSSVRAYPHHLAYFNELAGGPENGHKHLLHSNLDWGQDLLYLDRWLRQRRISWGDIELHEFGRDGMASLLFGQGQRSGTTELPRYRVVSASRLTGERRAVVSQADPAARVGYTLWIYENRHQD